MIEVRPVHVRDVQQVVALITEVLAEFGLRFGEGHNTDSLLLDLPGSYEMHGGAFWVAVASGEVVGTCGAFPVGPDIFELRKMYLRPAARGSGLGRRLLDEAIAWIRARGGHRVVLDTTHQMGRAIAFYEAHGFVRDDREIRGSLCSRGYTRDV